MNQINTELAEMLASVLGTAQTLPADESLLHYGLNSMKTMRIVGLLRQKGIRVSFPELSRKPTLNAWAALCAERAGAAETEISLPAADAAPFPLTDVQQAYLTGRADGQPLGGISCHVYIEFDRDSLLDTKRLHEAWKQLLAAHPMLRAKFDPDGTQQITETAASEAMFELHDLRYADETVQEQMLAEIRAVQSHRKLRVGDGICAGLAVCLLSGQRMRLCFDLDLLVADVVSFKIILDDLAALYRGEQLPVQKDWSFRSYLAAKQARDAEKLQADRAYWESVTADWKTGSQLPLAARPEAISGAAYTRHQTVIAAADYQALRQDAANNQTTIAMLLLTLYANVLSRWSGSNDLLINLPLFNRDLSLKGTEHAVADFTELLLLDIHIDPRLPLAEQIAAVRQRFCEHYEHSAFGGMAVQKLLTASGKAAGIPAPVVFSCTEGIALISGETAEVLGKTGFMLTQTPQVYIDFQTFQSGGDLVCIWDVPDGLFPAGMIPEMFGALEQSIRRAIALHGDWSAPLSSFDPVFAATSEFDPAVPVPGYDRSEPDRLYSGFWRNAAAHPERTAVIDSESGTAYSYGALAALVSALAEKLCAAGVKPQDKVLVTVQRGITEIVSILAVLSAGGCYVPVTPDQPAERRHKAAASMGIRFAVADDPAFNAGALTVIVPDMQRSSTLFVPVGIPADSSAYVILTSGTTGEPKGVEIPHCGAVNTIRDVNARIGLSPDDRLLAVSSVDFDLSVYDMFGTFAAGAALTVLGHAHYRDAEYWLRAVQQYRISVWNSVPMLFDMLMTSAEQAGQTLPLRAVMLSGDWVSEALPRRLRAMDPECRFIAMGGATEASIWSNWYEVRSEADIRGKFIPYGWALDRQAYRIVDAAFRDCPHHVPGELLIGGAGLAKGYCGDPQKTAEKFIQLDGARWYRTGDRGRFHADGCIEFLGRMDQQCKVRGHRIEVEEIEKHLEDWFRGCRAAVWAEGAEGAFNRLAACVFGYQGEMTRQTAAEATAYLRKHLPPYMIPAVIHTHDVLPLSGNGKVDRKRIQALFADAPAPAGPDGDPGHSGAGCYAQIRHLWCENLGIADASPEDNYYLSGGDSLKAIRLAAAVNQAFGVALKSAEVLELQELGQLAACVQEMKDCR